MVDKIILLMAFMTSMCFHCIVSCWTISKFLSEASTLCCIKVMVTRFGWVGYIKVLAFILWFNNLPGLGCDLRVSASRILVVWVYHGFRDAAFRIVLCLGVSLLCMGNVMVSRLCVLICMRGFRKSWHVLWMCVLLWLMNMLVSFFKRGIGIAWNSKRIIF